MFDTVFEIYPVTVWLPEKLPVEVSHGSFIVCNVVSSRTEGSSHGLYLNCFLWFAELLRRYHLKFCFLILYFLVFCHRNRSLIEAWSNLILFLLLEKYNWDPFCYLQENSNLSHEEIFRVLFRTYSFCF